MSAATMGDLEEGTQSSGSSSACSETACTDVSDNYEGLNPPMDNPSTPFEARPMLLLPLLALNKARTIHNELVRLVRDHTPNIDDDDVVVTAGFSPEHIRNGAGLTERLYIEVPIYPSAKLIQNIRKLCHPFIGYITSLSGTTPFAPNGPTSIIPFGQSFTKEAALSPFSSTPVESLATVNDGGGSSLIAKSGVDVAENTQGAAAFPAGHYASARSPDVTLGPRPPHAFSVPHPSKLSLSSAHHLPPPEPSGSASAIPPSFQFEITTKLNTDYLKAQSITLTGIVAVESSSLRDGDRDVEDCSVSFLSLGGTCIQNLSYDAPLDLYQQQHMRIQIDSKDQLTNVFSATPRPTAPTFSTDKMGTLTLSTALKAAPPKPPSADLGLKYSRAMKEGTANQYRSRTELVVCQNVSGRVWWGIDIDEAEERKNGAQLADRQRLPSCRLIQEPGDEGRGPSPSVAFDVCSFWSLPSSPVKKRNKLKTKERSITQPIIRNFCQVLAVPELAKRIKHSTFYKANMDLTFKGIETAIWRG